MPLERFQTPRVEDATEAVEAARRLLDAGTDGLKLYAVTIGRRGIALPETAIQALVKEAHGRGEPVFAHPTTAADLMASVRGGVDVLAHTTPQSGPWDESVVAAMKQAGVALIPTLTLSRYELRHERISVADGFEETAVGQLRAWLSAGGVVLFGTDVGYMTEYDPTEEYALMLGRIVPGLAADLTVLTNDPTKDIRALATVRYTIRDGRIIYRTPRRCR